MELRRDDLARAAGDRDRSRAERLGNTEREIRQAQAEALGRTGSGSSGFSTGSPRWIAAWTSGPRRGPAGRRRT